MTVAVEQLAGALLDARVATRLRSASRRSCAHPATAPGPCASRATSRSATGTGRRRVWSTDTEPDGDPAQGVRQPPRGRLPAVRRALPRRRLPAHRRGTARRQGRPRVGGRAPGAVRHADRAELRARPHPAARTGRQAAALPATTRRARLPARRPAVLRPGARRGRPVPRRAAVPRSASTTRRGRLEQRARRAVAAHDDLPPARARAADRHDAEARCASSCASPTSRSPSTSAAASCTCTSSSGSIARCPPTAPTSSRRPPARFDVELLEDAIRAAVDEVSAPIPDELGGGRVRWGARARRAPARPRRAPRGRRLPRQVRDQEHRAGRRRPAPRRRAPGRRAPRARARPRATCARPSRSTATPRSPIGGFGASRTRSATAATA